MNIKLNLQYDGTNYHGWQIQPNGVTVQELLQNAVFEITRQKTAVTGCGRTDAGVHALDYVCNFHADTNIPIEKIPNALNSHLPDDVRVFNAEIAEEDFHASDSAVKKRYVYQILNREFDDAFLTKYAWHYRYKLNISDMQKAAEAFLGEHDFIGFASSGFTVKTTVRTIYSLDITENNGLITLDITGNGFLYNMVRIIAGTLVYVGSGKIDAGDTADIIASRDRKRAGITAPAKGLFLREVFY